MNLTFRTTEEIKLHFKKIVVLSVIKDGGRLLINDRQVEIIPSLPVDMIIDGSKNGLELYGIGRYELKLSDTEFYIFQLFNNSSCRNDFVIVPRNELNNRLHTLNKQNDYIILRLWLTSANKMLESFGYGAEGEFMALWLDKRRNFTIYHNKWSLLL